MYLYHQSESELLIASLPFLRQHKIFLVFFLRASCTVLFLLPQSFWQAGVRSAFECFHSIIQPGRSIFLFAPFAVPFLVLLCHFSSLQLPSVGTIGSRTLVMILVMRHVNFHAFSCINLATFFLAMAFLASIQSILSMSFFQLVNTTLHELIQQLDSKC